MKYFSHNKKSAFSLIELSVVILIIGIAIAGVLQGSRMVRASKLSSARTLTQSSPVSGIKNLILWLDATSVQSFSYAQTEDDTTFETATGGGKWYNVNPQDGKRSYISADSNSIKYNENGINNLPTITFRRDEVEISHNSFSIVSDAYAFEPPSVLGDPIIFSGDAIDAPYHAYTIFTISRTKESGYIFYNGDVNAPNGFGVTVNLSLQNVFHDGGTHSDITGSLSGANNSTELTTVTLSPSFEDGETAQQTLNIWRNGRLDVSEILSAPDTIIKPDNGFYLASSDSMGNNSFDGDISEIIIYGRLLTIKERKAVEDYLMKKYDIAT